MAKISEFREKMSVPHPRQGVVFDEEQPDLLNPLSPKIPDPRVDLSEEDTPLQRPRPPERTLSKRPENARQRLSNRLSVMYMWSTNHNRTANNGAGCKTYDSVHNGEINHVNHSKQSRGCCKQKGCCVIVLPTILLSLVLIGVSAMLIYLHLLQEYHAEIDKLRSELQAARDKDGVFLPKETYDEQIKMKENMDKEIKEKTMALRALEEELEKFKEIISETTAKLEETEAQREETQRALDCTRTVLHKTEGERAEQAHLVARHVETECKLSQQAQLLLTVSDEATKDLDKVHNKLDRKRLVEKANEATLGDYRSASGQRHTKLEGLLSNHVEIQNDYCSQERTRIDAATDRRAEERSQLTSSYAETVSKLINTMGNIERVTSDQMYAEQSWVEQLLKRVRNEADSATNDFHGYLVDQLLTVSTKILAALQNQDKTVQDLSAKLDKNFAGINQRLEEYLADAAKLRSNKMAAEADFFAGLQRRNAALETSFTADLKETEEYVKKSNAFTEQMMSLIKARAQEEEAFLAARNKTVNSALEMTSATSEATGSAATEGKQFDLAAARIDTGFKDTHADVMMRVQTEKARAMEEIDQAGQQAAKATAQIRADAEEFAQKGKDHWANHYSRTEASLREKSDKSSEHVVSLQRMTDAARKSLMEGQSASEDAIESWRRADEQATRAAHEKVSAQCAAVADFGMQVRDELRAADHAVSSLIDKQIKRDVPTGETPGRVARSFPNKIIQGTPDDIRKQRFREKWNASGLASKIDMENIEDSDLVEASEAASSADSLNDSRDSVFSGSKMSSAPLSRQDSGGQLKSNKSSRTNLSEVSADTGIIEDVDNKENFRQPRASKLKQPEIRTRSGSRTRTKLGSAPHMSNY